MLTDVQLTVDQQQIVTTYNPIMGVSGSATLGCGPRPDRRILLVNRDTAQTTVRNGSALPPYAGSPITIWLPHRRAHLCLDSYHPNQDQIHPDNGRRRARKTARLGVMGPSGGRHVTLAVGAADVVGDPQLTAVMTAALAGHIPGPEWPAMRAACGHAQRVAMYRTAILCARAS
jgi:hypothetical protein